MGAPPDRHQTASGPPRAIPWGRPSCESPFKWPNYRYLRDPPRSAPIPPPPRRDCAAGAQRGLPRALPALLRGALRSRLGFTGESGKANVHAVSAAMPLPLAHPAAVLPLKRHCPRWLSFPALVIGSVTPDAGYLFGERYGGKFSHGLLGSIVFCLPVGILMVLLFYWLRGPLVRALPTPYQQILLPLCKRPAGSPWAILLGLLVGTCTHLLWDSFTHTDGWFVERLPVLSSQIALVTGRRVRICHLLWYGCSFAGVVWLVAVFEKWKRAAMNASMNAPAGSQGKAVMLDAVLVAIAVVPIELVHHLVRLNRLGLCLLGIACAFLVLGVVLRTAYTHRSASTANPTPESREAE